MLAKVKRITIGAPGQRHPKKDEKGRDQQKRTQCHGGARFQLQQQTAPHHQHDERQDQDQLNGTAQPPRAAGGAGHAGIVFVAPKGVRKRKGAVQSVVEKVATKAQRKDTQDGKDDSNLEVNVEKECRVRVREFEGDSTRGHARGGNGAGRGGVHDFCWCVCLKRGVVDQQ